MYVLHALFSVAGSWELWAECAEPGTARPRASSGQQPARHPFALDPRRLADVLACAGDDIGAAARKADPRGMVALMLPSRPAGPEPSVALAGFRPPRTARADVALRPWTVPTLVLDPADGAALFEAIGAVAGAGVLPLFDPVGRENGGVPLADSVRYALELTRFAESLVRAGEVLPALHAEADPDDEGSHHEYAIAGNGVTAANYYASWQPTYTLGNAVRRASLIESMPPAFRAELTADRPAGQPAADVFDDTVGALVDALVLDALTGPRGLSGARLTASTPLTAADPAAEAQQSAAVAWLKALLSASGNQLDPRLDAGRVETLAAAVHRWHIGFDDRSGPLRVCFRLREPVSDPGAPWRVEILLQSRRDPSLLATAAQVWRRAGPARLLRADGAEPRIELLAGLDRAARVFPSLATVLKQVEPVEVALGADAAHTFLSRTAPALAANGFGVLLPPWWTDDGARLGVSLTAVAADPGSDCGPYPGSSRDSGRGRRGSGRAGPEQPGSAPLAPQFGLDTLVDYAWRVSLGDEPLTDAEFRALIQENSPLVRLRGRWVEIDRARLAGAIGALDLTGADGRLGRMRAGDLLRTAVLGLPGPDGAQQVPIEALRAEGWLGDLLSGVAEQRCRPLPASPGLRATLRPYQERGVGWLAFMHRLGLGAVLADSMGLGKTVQVLALLEAERAGVPDVVATADGAAGGDRRAPRRPTLLICPMSLVANWQHEAARFTPELRVHVHHGAERFTGAQFRAAIEGIDLVITTYGLALRDRAELATAGWHRVVIDEAQAIKNASTKQARAVYAIPAPHRIALTGTPVENRLADLWSIFQFANPGLLGSAESFKERFALPIERDGDAQAAARLRMATRAFMLRREKTDPAIIQDLPDKVEMTVLCGLTGEQASLYQAVVDESLARISTAEGLGRRGLVLALLTRLKQVCNHPAHFLRDGSALSGRSGKLAMIEEVCEEVLDAGEKALLFTQYAEYGRMLQRYLAERFGREVALLHGGVPKKSRDAMVTRFGRADGPPLFVLSLKAGGVGLNLAAANHVIHVDRWWNPAVEDQATDRAYRIGQTRNVQVRRLVCAGTLEERIDEAMERKRALAGRIVRGGEEWLTELSVAELRDVVRLTGEPAVE